MKRKTEEYRPRKEKHKYIPVPLGRYPVIRAFHKIWFKDCQCEFCHDSKK